MEINKRARMDQHAIRLTHGLNTTPLIRVAAYSKDEELINTLKSSIKPQDNLHLAGIFKNYRDLPAGHKAQCIDTYVIDMRQPTRQHFQLLSQLQGTEFPVNMLCIIDIQDIKHILTAFDLGARGFTTNNIIHIIAAIHAIHRDATILPLYIITHLITIYRTKQSRSPHTHPTLTPREQQILACLRHGQHAKTIAHNLQISIETLRTHRKNILAKLNCRTTIQAIARSQGD